MDNLGVHVTHCCLDHGCKYRDDDCPVFTGAAAQMYECEDCDGQMPVVASLDDFVAAEMKRLSEFAQARRDLNSVDPLNNPLTMTVRQWRYAVARDDR